MWGEPPGVCIRPMKGEWPDISAFRSQSGVDEGIDWGVEDDSDLTRTDYKSRQGQRRVLGYFRVF